MCSLSHSLHGPRSHVCVISHTPIHMCMWFWVVFRFKITLVVFSFLLLLSFSVSLSLCPMCRTLFRWILLLCLSQWTHICLLNLAFFFSSLLLLSSLLFIYIQCVSSSSLSFSVSRHHDETIRFGRIFFSFPSFRYWNFRFCMRYIFTTFNRKFNSMCFVQHNSELNVTLIAFERRWDLERREEEKNGQTQQKLRKKISCDLINLIKLNLRFGSLLCLLFKTKCTHLHYKFWFIGITGLLLFFTLLLRFFFAAVVCVCCWRCCLLLNFLYVECLFFICMAYIHI